MTKGKDFLVGDQRKPPNDFFETTFGDLLDQRAEEYGDKEAIVYVSPFEKSYSYKDYRDMCNKVAKSLRMLGVRKGDHVAMWGTNIPQWIFTLGGAAKIGAVLVTVNTNYKASELEYLLQQSDSNTLVLIDEHKGNRYLDSVYQIAPELKDSEPGKLNSENLPKLKNVIFAGGESDPDKDEEHPGMFSWNEFLELGSEIPDNELSRYQSACDPHDVFNIQYTSGTTGFPKGVMLTHYNVINNAWYVGEAQNYTDAERLCTPVPFFHCFGLTMSITACLTHGATILPVPFFDPEWVLKTLDKGKSTACQGVPTMWRVVLDHPDFEEYDLKHLRTGIMAGSNCPMELMKQVTEHMAPEVTISFGQTETSPVLTKTRPSDPLERRVSTVGRPLPNIEVKVFDPETDEEVDPGETGEIRARGYPIMKGYYKMEDETNETITENGWVCTGDLGVMDEEGYLSVTGRLKDMIIRGGENIYPREIEEFLYTHPKVSDVQIIGAPSKKYGEELAAYIKLAEGEEATENEIKEFCTGQIARHKIPKYIKFIDDYPMTASGKIQKYKLRDKAIEDFNLHDQLEQRKEA
ncbi:AMP-binding protein [Natranaerofaba carboxydovora]|uniref:AMP-binding protein n=1 Tax=Natranaerofaba carboxydovora TaxID=2742683 RepID=UPI001F143CDC|nr:AMP-binding protein [Natranaerofaba carboxydovora]UMZ73599.1 3-[(3aS,4S,7aS)-7a-methyl-1,5-dioxo-octahydro-1H-inden-4-yl]propanoyl:CoA ligase [Natranaerofaba carboxydovora]